MSGTYAWEPLRINIIYLVRPIRKCGRRTISLLGHAELVCERRTLFPILSAQVKNSIVSQSVCRPSIKFVDGHSNNVYALWPLAKSVTVGALRTSRHRPLENKCKSTSSSHPLITHSLDRLFRVLTRFYINCPRSSAISEQTNVPLLFPGVIG